MPRHLRASFCALFIFFTSATLAQTPDELAQKLLPVPHSIEITAAPKVRPAKETITAFCAFGKESAGFDPLAPVASFASCVDHASTTGDGRWIVVFSTAPKTSAFASYQKIAHGLGAEQYILITGGDASTIAVLMAGGPRGLLYGSQTLAQLLELDPKAIPSVRIEDQPDVTRREVHIHGFDRGYGAGDLKSLESFKTTLPRMMPSVAAARFNLFRMSLDAGWITDADRWVNGDIDATMRSAIESAHRAGVEMLIEIRLQGQDPGSVEPKLRPLNPMTEWDCYEKAVRRALSWGPDVLDFSCNDLGALRFPEIEAKYGKKDGRYSGVLMADLLRNVQAIIAQVRPATRLRILPRFYGAIHWQHNPTVLEDFWSHAPRGIMMETTAGLVHPAEVQMRAKYGASFAWWVNYTSNHAKELRVMLDAIPNADLSAIAQLPASERNVVVNLGYPIEPQRTVVLATGEWLWNVKAYDRHATLARAARRVWGDGPDRLFMQYADRLSYETIMGSLGMRAAELIAPVKKAADEEDGASTRPTLTREEQLRQWKEYETRAEEAAQIARKLQAMVTNDELKKVADILYWNAQRVRLDSQIGVMFCSVADPKQIDASAVEAILQQHEQILREHFPVEKNDPKSAEVVTRGIRRIREALAGLK
jgi:hypothetical protein